MNELAQSLRDAMQQQSTPTNTKEEKKNSNFNPHLAVTSVEQGGAANGRNNPLLMKSTANEEFELFCKSMTDKDTLLALYNMVKSDDKQLLKNIITKGK